jgi:hypothetical protein
MKTLDSHRLSKRLGEFGHGADGDDLLARVRALPQVQQAKPLHF